MVSKICFTWKNVATSIFGLCVGFSLAFMLVRPQKFNLRGRHYVEGPALDAGNHTAHAFENGTVANQIYKEVKILCWIMTQPDNHKKKAKHVFKTWGKRCNKLIFMSSAKGKCLEAVQVAAGDSRDVAGKGRFFPFHPEFHLLPGAWTSSWYWDYKYYKTEEGPGSCSDNAISFHYISPNYMYVFEYLIYHLRPYGIVHNSQPLPEKYITTAPKTEQARTPP